MRGFWGCRYWGYSVGLFALAGGLKVVWLLGALFGFSFSGAFLFKEHLASFNTPPAPVAMMWN